MKKEYNVLKEFAVLPEPSEETKKAHTMVVYLNNIYVLGDNTVYEIKLPPMTLWKKIKEFLGF